MGGQRQRPDSWCLLLAGTDFYDATGPSQFGFFLLFFGCFGLRNSELTRTSLSTVRRGRVLRQDLMWVLLVDAGLPVNELEP